MKRGGFGKDPGNSRPIACLAAEALLAKPDWHECRPGSLFSRPTSHDDVARAALSRATQSPEPAWRSHQPVR